MRSEFWSKLGTPIRSGVRPGWVRQTPSRDEIVSKSLRNQPRRQPANIQQDFAPSSSRPLRNQPRHQPANIQQDVAPRAQLRRPRDEQKQNGRVGPGSAQTMRLRIPRQSRDRFLGNSRNVRNVVARPERRLPTERQTRPLLTPSDSIKQRQVRGRQPQVVGRAVRPSDLPSSNSRQNSFAGNLNKQRIGTPRVRPDRLNAKVMRSSSPAALSSSTSSTTTQQQTWPVWALTLVVVSAIVIVLMSVLVVMLFKWMHKLRHPIHG